MGGAVSSGRDNNELVDNLMSGGYIRNPYVERVFRVLNRADYMTPLDRNQAYKDLAWRSGALHLSAPCIYSEVMEALELRPGQAFLNVGSGTGYLSTLAGLILGTSGISHGIEIHPGVVEYSTKKLSQFQENSVTLDEFDFCIPKYYCGNALCLAPLQTPYDRVYVGAGVLNKYDTYFKHMIKVGGILVMPLDDALVQIKRVSETVWNTRQLLNVSFALLRPPTKEETAEPMRLDDLIPVSLMLLSRAAIRRAMLVGVCRRHPELKEPPSRRAVAVRPRSRHICIPLDNDSDEASLNELHNLNEQEGAREMNALLSLVLTMGTNRIAGSLNFGEDQERDFGTGANDELEVMMEAPITESSSSSEEDSYPPRPRAAFRPSVAGAANVCSMDERVDRRTRSTVWTPLVREPGDSDFNTLTPAGRVEVERRARFSKPSLTPDRGDDTGSTSSDSDSSKPATSGESLGAGRSVASLDHPIGWGPKPATSGESHGEGGSAPSSGTKRSGGAGGGGGGGSGGGGGGKVSGCHVRRRYRAAPGSRLRRARANLRRSKRYPPELQMYFGNAGVYSQTDVVHSSPEGVSASVSDTHTRDPPSSDDEPLSTTQEKKRQKLDSGIGEGTATATATASASASASTSTSASAGSSSQTTPEESSYTDASTTDNQNPAASGRRRGSRRGYESGAEGARPAAVARRVRRHARDARRVRLSIVMKRAVKELPLPRPLKKFVNLYRCYEF